MPDPLVKPKFPKPNPLEGAALIIVLSCVVLLAALAIGLLNRVEADRANASAYRGSTLTRNLAEYAINVVMAQISGATKSDPALAWASQPGAIRTYSATSTNLQAIYKLYSSTNMVVGAFPSGDTNLSDWANNTALYTDLNARVVSGSGDTARTNYPILDPSAFGVVQGFDITGAPTTPTQPAPMPVNWLYVLEDGTLSPPASAAGNNTVTVTGASAANPIVGRIAFWTDDDTSKININTASGAPWNYTNTTVTTTWGETRTVPTPANFWDTPFAGTTQEANLAIAQPWGGEYQRYPGHPASVSLSAVFTNLTTNDIMAIAPRLTYQNGGANVGSRWGSFVTVHGSTNGGAVTLLDPPANNIRIPDDGSRLYANVDELLFATNRSATGINTITPRQIEQARFFLTASSRAPDVTLFNTPRLLVWPITFTNGNTTKMTPYDQLIAFCGTVGGATNIGGTNSYYFTRWNPDSPTADYDVARNRTLINYLRRMTETPVPGFDGTGILSKYTAANEPDQIRTQIFDYIRCINTRDMSMAATPGASNQYIYAISNSIMPSAGTNDTRGFGRFPTVTKVGVHFWFNNYFTNVVTNAGIPTTNTNVSLIGGLGIESFVPSQGYPTSGSHFNIIVDGISSLRWGVDSANTAQIFTNNTITNRSLPPWQRGGRSGFSRLTATSSPLTTNSATLFSTNTNDTFYFGGGNLTIRVMNRAGTSTHQELKVNLPPTTLPMPLDTYLANATHTTNWGTNTSFTEICFNGLSNSTVWTNGVNTNITAINLNTNRSAGTITTTFRPQDVVRAVAVSHGDFRLISANPNVSATNFVPVNGGTNINAYFSLDSLQRIAHNFVGDFPYSWMGARFPLQNYYNNTNTSFTLGTTNTNAANFGPTNISQTGTLYNYQGSDAAEITTTAVNGDFDNGYGNAADGPFIGFADEGNLRVSRFYYTNKPSEIKFSLPYLDGSGSFVGSSEGFFSPNRLVPSAGIMGSLPTGVKSETPWQTLLFRPRALTSSSHPGGDNPPDYLLLDLFNMPVVEPYAISEPLSTAGRVNMNYQILPFTYIKRSTALRAALHTEHLGVIPNTNSGGTNIVTNQYRKYNQQFSSRLSLNLNTNNGTLRGFEDRFGSNDIFRSAAEICSIPLVPTNSTWSAVTGGSFWPNYTPTGENTKERPYARIYPKLTTKSNTYTVHYRVEVLKKRPNSPPDTWTEGQDNVISTYRGSTTIERYVNPRDPALPDYASTNTLPPTGPNALPNFYKFRILGERQFNP
jgi:uncharacterized protein (TIGR02600 family)